MVLASILGIRGARDKPEDSMRSLADMQAVQAQGASLEAVWQMVSGLREMFVGMQSGETEAGTTQRDVVRLGVVSIAVSFSVSPRWLKVLTGFKQKEKISEWYFDTESLEMKEAEMFVEGYKAVLVKDTSYKGLWKVSFTLKEF